MDPKRIVISGAAGFIGMHLATYYADTGCQVICIDNLNPAYSDYMSKLRVNFLNSKSSIEFENIDISDPLSHEKITKLLSNADLFFHLAAWPGVRLSQEVPGAYLLHNVTGFNNVLEAVRVGKPKKFLFASSSSIYGNLGTMGPVKEEDATGLNLKSIYAATKWTNEILAMRYQEITKIPTLALRFFTVFGEYGRPDMAYWAFMQKMLDLETIELYGEDGGTRNYTYITDAIEIISRLATLEISGFEAFNISSGEPITTRAFLTQLAKHSQFEPKIHIVQRPSIDVESTWADSTKLEANIGSLPKTHLETAISNFAEWFLKLDPEIRRLNKMPTKY